MLLPGPQFKLYLKFHMSSAIEQYKLQLFPDSGIIYFIFVRTYSRFQTDWFFLLIASKPFSLAAAFTGFSDTDGFLGHVFIFHINLISFRISFDCNKSFNDILIQKSDAVDVCKCYGKEDIMKSIYSKNLLQLYYSRRDSSSL